MKLTCEQTAEELIVSFLVRKTRPTVEKMRIYDTLKYSPIISCPGRARFNRRF